MLKNQLRIIFRNFRRNKVFTTINILGLSIGMATCLLIMLFIREELSYDRYNDKADRIVRVAFHGVTQGEKLNEPSVMPPTAQALKADYPEVLDATRLRAYGTPRITYGEKTFRDAPIAFADSNFFRVFTIPLLQGNAGTALLQPNTIVISRAIAEKYFGHEDPMGKALTLPDLNNTTVTVTGVFDKVPANSHFHFDCFASMASLPEARSQSWMQSEFYTYLVLPEGYDYRKLEARLPRLVDKYIGPQFQKGLGMSLEEFRSKGNSIGFYLQPLTDIHLHSDFAFDLSPAGDIRYIYIFGAIAAFMLVIACINFMNLSTAGASRRAREVGIRKVLGSGKGELVRQFLLESLLLTAMALILSLTLVAWALPFFNQLSGKDLHVDLISAPGLLAALALFGLFTGLLAGSYPAFFLSAFNPVAVLKQRFTAGKKTVGLRSALVVFQFCISITLIVGTLVVYRQLSYIQHKKLGYDKDQVLIVQETFWLDKNQGVFQRLLLQDPRVLSVSRSDYLPAGPSDNNNFFITPDNDRTHMVKAIRYDVDDQYIPTLGMELAAGRNFSPAFNTDSSGIILNETAATALGWGQHALGHSIARTGSDGRQETFHVIGVVRDFHFKSLHERISPLAMVLGGNGGNLIIKTRTKDIAGLLSMARQHWADLKAASAFTWSFLDERFRDTYQSEQRIGMILGLFAGLTIFVACLGLFGLATFTAEQRVKEIGIRKVLGASVTGIVTLLAKDFIKLVGIAFVIAAPIAWYAMNKWLQDFAYRITINVWIFLAAAVASIAIAMLTISFRAIRAGRANPTENLRSE